MTFLSFYNIENFKIQIKDMEKRDPEGLKKLLWLMNFKVMEEGENIIASGQDYNRSGNNIWVSNIEEILIPSVYGYSANFKRWKIFFVPNRPNKEF